MILRIVSITGGNLGRLLLKAAEETKTDFSFYQSSTLAENPEKIPQVITSMRTANLILIYLHSAAFWDEIKDQIHELGSTIPVLVVGNDPVYWTYSTVDLEIVKTCQKYMIYGGQENMTNLLCYLSHSIFQKEILFDEPREIPFQGIYHPDAPSFFTNIQSYISWHAQYRPPSQWVGIIFSRLSWTGKNTDIEDCLIHSLQEQGLNVIPVFSHGVIDESLGSIGISSIIKEYFMEGEYPRVSAIIKLLMTPIGPLTDEEYVQMGVRTGSDLYRKLGVPVFHPVIATYMSLDQWEESAGLTTDVAWGVTMPEFEGEIEPFFIGARSQNLSGDLSSEPVPDRCDRIAERVYNWISLAKKPTYERKIAFILNNNPCSSVEANVGAASHLDSLESVARILQTMQDERYSVFPPLDGKELIKTIMDRKAISEFRWTTTEEIINKGGTLSQMDMKTYLSYFSTLSQSVQDRVNATWGVPPGVGMVHDNRLLITGVSYGNAVVCVQPKRGCHGSACDGAVCKMLHDPDCPPPHHYLATYYYLTQIFKADVIVHVGTHGNLEFLPGKGVGLSSTCFPDIAIGSIPHLYIYNADNPAEGTIAKRRAYATLIDHMQTTMTQGSLYDELEEIEDLLSQYETTKGDPARAHALQHFIRDAIEAAHLDKDIHLTHDTPLEVMVSRTHEALSRIRNTQIPSGMHILGELPVGEKRIDFINSIIRFDTGDYAPRRIISGIMGIDFSELLEHPEKWSDKYQQSYGSLLESLSSITREIIRSVISGQFPSNNNLFSRRLTPTEEKNLENIAERIKDINQRIESSEEIKSLLTGFQGLYINPGPSGLITRGHEEVLPTGRNFYSLDPYRVPTRAAWRVGQRLADILLDKHQNEEGFLPENVAFYWMAGDIMSADGEMFAEILWLLGVEPIWQKGGQVKSFSIIPLDQLGRPRIDITVRTSGILRDNFSVCYELVDEAVQTVASLDEPDEMNFIRKHASKRMKEEGISIRDATFRIFSSRPRTYGNGVNLAVLSSAWKTEDDLVDVFITWNGYAYGKGIQGKEAHTDLASNLSTVSVTFNKVQSDEYDLLGCCCYFGNQGGLTVAARHFSNHDVKPYYGDTREPEKIEVRDLSDEIRRVVRTKLLNPKWIEGMKEHGYKGASTIMKRISRVYGWEASTQEVDDWIFDDIAETFVNNDEMRQFFEENNPYALEEITRRLLEAEQRGLWNADQLILDKLKNNYLEIESWMEEQAGEGDFQGGSVDILTASDIPAWGDSMKDLMGKVHQKVPRKN